jgi:hypothetical protein
MTGTPSRPTDRRPLAFALLFAASLACPAGPAAPDPRARPPAEPWTAPAAQATFEEPLLIRAEPEMPIDAPLPTAAPTVAGDQAEGDLQTTILGQLTLAPGARSGLRVVVERAPHLLDAEPAAGVDVWLALGGGAASQTVFHGRTGPDGAADVNFRVPATMPAGESLLVLHVREEASGSWATLARTVQLVDATRVLLTTDKPLYQPGQTIHLRALALASRASGARGELPVTFVVEDAKGNKLFRKTVRTSAQGVASLDFPVADRVNTGEWKVTLGSDAATALAEKTIKVEPYVLPKFDIDVRTERAWYLPGGLVTGTVQARYFFGKPVARGRVEIRAKLFDAEFVVFADVTGETDADGTYGFSVPLPQVLAGNDLENGNARVMLETMVTDTADQEERDTSSVVVAGEPISLLVMPESGTLEPGVDNVLWIAAASPDGSPVTGTATVDFGDGTVTATTDELGLATVRFRAERPGDSPLAVHEVNGQVVLDVRFTASSGETVEKPVLLESRPSAGDHVLLRLTQAIARAGYPTTLEVLATRSVGTVFVDVVQGRQTMLTKALTLHDGRASWELVVPSDVAGTLELHAYLLGRDGTFVRDGRVMVVEPADELRIAVETSKEEYLPGERALLRFAVTDAAGRPKAAALGVLMVDEAVYALQEMQPGLEKVYFLLEQEILKPRIELHFAPGAVTLEEAIKVRRPGDAKQRAALVLLASAEPSPAYDLEEIAARKRETFRAQSLPRLYEGLERRIGLLGAGGLLREDDPARFRGDALEQAAEEGFVPRDAMVSPTGGPVEMEDLEALESGLTAADVAPRAAQWGVLHLYRLVGMWARLKASWCPGDLGQDGAGLYCVPEDVANQLVHTKAPGEAARVGLAEEEMLLDPWGRRYVVHVDPDGAGPDGPLPDLAGVTILSKGADGLEGTDDDVRWDEATPRLGRTEGGEYDRWLATAAGPAVRRALTEREEGWDVTIDELLYERDERRWAARERRWAREAELRLGDAATYGSGMFAMAYGYGVGDGVGFGRGGGMGHGYGTGEGVGFGRSAAALGAAEQAAPRVREYFPETLLWNPELITDEQGKAQLEVDLADSITSWRLGVLASSADGALGSQDKAVRVFQPFFVDLDLPVALTQNDEVSVPVAIFNYLDEPQNIALELEKADWFEPLVDRRATVSLGPQQVTSHSFPIRALRPGAHTLTVYAVGERRSDAVRRNIRVEPDGVPVEETVSQWLAGETTHAFTMPADAIAGSESLEIKVYPGAVAQAVENLDSMLQVPSGCFEQTSSSTYPNVLILDYLKRTGTITPEIQLKAEQYVQLGYQRLVTFELRGGGFEWFGAEPANTVLTAYGLREFVDMAEVYPVDDALIERTRRFLVERQNSDGSWDMEGGGYRDGAINRQEGNTLNITAYVAWALATSGEADEAVAQGRGWLGRQLDAVDDPYSLALMLQVFAGEGDAGRRRRILEKLAVARSVDEEGGVHWDGEEASAFGSQGDVAAIETTALIAAALVQTGLEPELARGALDWLVRQKDALGNWRSTQATILALKALLLASAAGPRDVAATVEVIVNGTPLRTIEVTPETADILHLVDGTGALAAGENKVTVASSSGERNGLMAQITSRAFVPWPAEPPDDGTEPLDLRVEYDRTELATGELLRATVTLRYRSAVPVENAIVDLGVPPGFEVAAEDLDRAVAAGTIARWELTGRQLILYVAKLDPGPPLIVDYGLRAQYPLRARSPASSAWLYYQPEVRSEARPIEIIVTEP